ncbi:MAG TPA: ATP synthase F0 subunit C, partial [Candidatus Babeliales bacterium]|nr:ATP synthase F0 subunit C [Candidatus Babeliales bacterium]
LILRPLAPTADPLYGALAHIALVLALGVPGLIAGYVSAEPLAAAAHAVARQPFTTGKIINLLLITISFVQTPVILGFVISAWAHVQAATCTSWPAALKIIAAGLAVGLGSIGPIIGLAYFARGACQTLGRNRTIYSKILTFTFISAALIETPFVFALIVALLILQFKTATITPLKSWACLAGAIAVGLSNLMPGISSGRSATAACLELAQQPELYGQLSKTSIVVQSFIDSLALYGWIVALLLVLTP